MQTICAMLLCGVLAYAAQPSLSGSSADTSGMASSVYALSFHPGINTLPPGAIYVCRARIMPGVNASEPAKGSGNEAGCAVEVPFVWNSGHPQPSATVSYEVDAISTEGRVLRTVVREGVALPAAVSGITSHVDLNF